MFVTRPLGMARFQVRRSATTKPHGGKSNLLPAGTGFNDVDDAGDGRSFCNSETAPSLARIALRTRP